MRLACRVAHMAKCLMYAPFYGDMDMHETNGFPLPRWQTPCSRARQGLL